jgi:RecB family exonuclease
MNFNVHSNLKGLHAPFSASNYSWLRYDDDKALRFYENRKAKEKGTRIHDVAKNLIDLRIKQSGSKKSEYSYLYKYVNDAIGFRMDTEVVLFHSIRFFGTADAISFRDNVLRIHDLKTGETPASMDQLKIYAALFCLEYGIKPKSIDIVLRIYQYDDYEELIPEPEDIQAVMDKIIHFDMLLQNVE